ncbi:MAG: hypothetical protein EPO11_07095 [Gammaproteobacteria bacterium]|nr:MAG: hypothetical protein EPO11_07095 [Gammaproteobacteria bacterium]
MKSDLISLLNKIKKIRGSCKMVIIFLDIDGVLLSEQASHAIRYKFKENGHSTVHAECIKGFDQEALNNLNHLITIIECNGHEAGIVISSDWRLNHSVYELIEMFQLHAFSRKIVGKTVDRLPDNYDLERGQKIKAWLSEHKHWNITQPIILDDNKFDIPTLFPTHFVHCTKGVFSRKNVDTAISIFHSRTELASDLKVKPVFINAGAIAAVKEGRLDSLTQLISLWPELVNQKDACEQTPILLAARYGHTKMVEYLISQRADLHATTQVVGNKHHPHHNRTPLHWAAENGHYEIISLLIKAGAVIDSPSGGMKLQPMHLAATEGHLRCLQMLIGDMPERANQKDAYHQSPLLWAAVEGRAEIVQYLISIGADFNAATQMMYDKEHDHHNRTPLDWAIRNEYSEVALILIEAGAILDTSSGKMGLQSIHRAAQEGLLDVIKLLIEKRPDLLDQVDLCGKTPLYWAVRNDHSAIIDFLLKKNASVDKVWEAAFHNKNVVIGAKLYSYVGMISDLALSQMVNTQQGCEFILALGPTLKDESKQIFLQQMVTHAIGMNNSEFFHFLLNWGVYGDHHIISDDVKKKRSYLLKFVSKLIDEAKDPSYLVDLINNLFKMEISAPSLILRQGISIMDYRWNQQDVSHGWIKLVMRANKKILEMARDGAVEMNDEKIKIFLNTPTTRPISFFSAKSAVEKYEKIKSNQQFKQANPSIY